MDDGHGIRVGLRIRRADPLARFFLLAVSVSLLGGACARPSLHCGHTVVAGDHDTLLVALLHRGDGFLAAPVEGIEITFRSGGKDIARARTNRDGYAIAVGRVPRGAGELEASATCAGQAMESKNYVYGWKPGRTILVCDIDGTVSDTDYSSLVFHREDLKSKALPASAEVLQGLAGRYNLLYLTARPVALCDKTYRWLKNNGFPEAPVVPTPNLGDAIRAGQYKGRVIARLRQVYPEVLIGVGNADTDSMAYTENGMLALMIDDGRKRGLRSEALPMRSWEQLRMFFDANQGTLSKPARLRAILATGGLLLYPQLPRSSAAEPGPAEEEAGE